VNIQQLRQSLKVQWLNYYREHRDWLIRIGVWVTCEGKRRPSSSFILATLSVLEPKLIELLPLIVDLSSNPDRIVIALGLNFNPDEELETLDHQQTQSSSNGQMRMLPGRSPINIPAQRPVLEEPQPIAVESVSKPPSKSQAAPLQPPLRPTQQGLPLPQTTTIDHDPMDSPFGDLPEPLMETTEATSAPPAAKLPPQFPQPVARPVLDTDELAAGELPRREQVSATDAICEGVGERAALRNRKDSR
jgi:hypothetical protein